MDDYSIRKARVEDAGDILRLAKDLAHHDHIPPEFMTATEKGRGLGFNLLQSAAKIGHSKGCIRIRLLANKSNDEAKKFYQKIKFVNLTETAGWESLHLYGQDFENLATEKPKVTQDF